MRTLDQITTAVRRSESATILELTYAICAYDVLMSKLKVEEIPTQLQEYFIASDSDPKKYIEWVNDPVNADAVAWHKAFIKTE